MSLIAAISNLPYTYKESVNVKGFPACHAIDDRRPERTLCGKNPDGWTVLGISLQDVNCKVCLKRLQEVSKQ